MLRHKVLRLGCLPCAHESQAGAGWITEGQAQRASSPLFLEAVCNLLVREQFRWKAAIFKCDSFGLEDRGYRATDGFQAFVCAY